MLNQDDDYDSVKRYAGRLFGRSADCTRLIIWPARRSKNRRASFFTESPPGASGTWLPPFHNRLLLPRWDLSEYDHASCRGCLQDRTPPVEMARSHRETPRKPPLGNLRGLRKNALPDCLTGSHNRVQRTGIRPPNVLRWPPYH